MIGGLARLTEPFTRDSAREAAHRELSRQIYAGERPTLLQRAIAAVGRWIAREIDALVVIAPGGGLGILAVLVVVIVAVVLVRARLGPLRAATSDALDLDAVRLRTAAELRAEAADLAARQAWAEAVRARLRATVRGLEERDLLEPRPGRTAAEVAAEAGRALPPAGAAMLDAAQAFDEIWYGGRTATRQSYERVLAADDLAGRTRPVALAGGPS